MERSLSRSTRHYLNRFTSALFLILGLTGLIAPVSHAASGAFTLSAATYAVSEGAGKVNITINRVGGSTGTAAVSFRSNQGTATAGSDYAEIPLTTLNFAHREKQKTVSVDILNDTVVDPNETFQVLLSNPTNKTMLGSASSAAVTIQDDDVAALDITAPTVSLTSPTAGATFTSAQTVTITAAASDNIGISKVELYDGTTLLATDTTAPYSISWPITSAHNGSHSLTAKAYDAAGNSRVSTASTVAVNIPVADTTAPTVSLTSPANATTFTSAQTVTITAAASDNVGVSKVEFYDGATLLATDITAPYSFAWAITGANNGSHSLTAKAYDAAGNSKISAVTAVTVNIPVAQAQPGAFSYAVSSTSVNEGAGKVNITINRVGGSDGIVTVGWRTITFNGFGTADWATDYGTVAPEQTLTFANGESSKTISTVINDDNDVEGDETFTVKLQNPTGGASLGSLTSSIVTIVDNDVLAADITAPTISITNPVNGSTYTSAQLVVINASVQDNVGVTKVEFYDGTTLKGVDTEAPYSYTWSISSADNNVHIFSCKAYDAANNSQTSSPLNLNVNIVTKPSGPLPVIPGAEGFGSQTSAGRGGKIIKVSNLNDSGTGSLREALQATGPRVVVFEVGGVINLSSNITITSPYISVYGQSAPGLGIMLKNGGILVKTHDVLIQHLAIRPGALTSTGTDGVAIQSGDYYNIVLDHLSLSWAQDEQFVVYAGPHDITLSNCIIASEGFGEDHGSLIGDPATNITLRGNLYVNNRYRNPAFKGGAKAVMINNLIYNFAGDASYISDNYLKGPSFVSYVGNVFLKGPSYSTTYNGAAIYVTNNMDDSSRIYQANNYFDGGSSLFRNYDSPAVVATTSPIDLSAYTIETNWTTVRSRIQSSAGARPALRDAVDQRLVNDTINRTSTARSDYPAYPTTYRTLSIPADPNGDSDGNGYTNIEDLMHWMAVEIVAGS